MPDYIFKKNLNINGQMISCKVTGTPGSENDGEPFILQIPGGPGENTKVYAANIFKRRNEKSKKEQKSIVVQPHFILFDFPGCGESASAINPEKEYTLENFTQICGGVAEAVVKELKLSTIDLHIFGISAGGLFALNLLMHKPQWTDADSNIRLKSIFLGAAPTSTNLQNTKKFITENLALEPEHKQYIKGVEKLYSGTITTRRAYVDFIIQVTGAYSNKYQSYLNTILILYYRVFPNLTLNILKMISPEEIYDPIFLFSYDVLNHFFKNQFNGLKLDKTIQNFKSTADNPHKNIFSKIPIMGVYGDKDYCTLGVEHLNQLKAVIPEMASVVYPGKHHDISFNVLFYHFIQGDLEKLSKCLTYSGENIKINLPDGFKKLYLNDYKQSLPVAYIHNKAAFFQTCPKVEDKPPSKQSNRSRQCCVIL